MLFYFHNNYPSSSLTSPEKCLVGEDSMAVLEKDSMAGRGTSDDGHDGDAGFMDTATGGAGGTSGGAGGGSYICGGYGGAGALIADYGGTGRPGTSNS
jgi:hypothetical protein